MKVATIRMTLAELERLPDDGNRYELIDGDLYVSAAPLIKHQRLSMWLSELLSGFIRRLNLGELFAAPTDVTPEPDSQTRVQPDLFFVSVARSHIIRDDGVYGAPDLVIEILSESSHRTDREQKRDLYRRCGVQDYWLMDIENECVLVYRFAESEEPRILVPGDVLTTPLLHGLEIQVASLFR